MAFDPVKTLETVFKPIINPLVFKALKPLRDVKKLPGILIKQFQTAVKAILGTKEKSLNDYVAIGAYYVSKRLLVLIALIMLALIYILFIRPPAIVNKWFNRLPVVVESTPKAAQYTGVAKVVDESKQPRYVGALADGQYTGAGKLYADNGTILYEGQFDKGLKEGAGTLYDGQGRILYEGQFVADQYEGTGTLFREDGTILYSGEFLGGKYGGNGKLYDANGQLEYEGTFVEGVLHGPGKQLNANGQVVYEGEFAANVWNGAGTLYDGQGRLKYEGGFKDGRYAGEGTEYYPGGGVKYKGGFAAGTYNGAGELYDEQGVLRFKGAFRNGALNGPGEAYDEAGLLRYKGAFADGAYQGMGALYGKDGTVALQSFFDKGRASPELFLGLPSKQLEALLGTAGEVTMPEPALPTDEEAAETANEAVAAKGDSKKEGPVFIASAGSPEDAAQPGAGSSVPDSAPPDPNAPDVSFEMNFPDLQYTFKLAPSKTNPKEAVVTEVNIWGSKPLSVLQPEIETFKDGETTNAQGFKALDLRTPAPGGTEVSRYYRNDCLYSLTFVAGAKVAHSLEIIAIETVSNR